VDSDDGSQVTINNTVVYSKLVNQGDRTWMGGIYLNGDEFVNITIDYVQFGGGAQCRFDFEGPDWRVPQQLATTVIFHDNGLPATTATTTTQPQPQQLLRLPQLLLQPLLQLLLRLHRAQLQLQVI